MTNSKYLIQERSSVNGQSTIRPVQWGVTDKSEADRIANSRNLAAQANPANLDHYSVVEYQD